MLCAIGAGKKVQLLLEEEERFGAFELAQWRDFDGAMAAAEGANVVAGDEGEQVRPRSERRSARQPPPCRSSCRARGEATRARSGVTPPRAQVCCVPGSAFDGLPASIWRMVRDNLPEAVTFRRRDFEDSASLGRQPFAAPRAPAPEARRAASGRRDDARALRAQRRDAAAAAGAGGPRGARQGLRHLLVRAPPTPPARASPGWRAR